MQTEITADEAAEMGLSFVDLMKKYKPDITEEEADFILWNETCYPFDTEAIIKQIYHFFKKLLCSDNQG